MGKHLVDGQTNLNPWEVKADVELCVETKLFELFDIEDLRGVNTFGNGQANINLLQQ